MFRNVKSTTAVMIMLLFAGLAQAAPTPTLEIGKKFEGDISGKPSNPLSGGRSRPIKGKPQPARGYQSEIPIKLTAGQGITISASVVGTDRKVAVFLFDPTHTPIDYTKSELKTSQLTVGEINASGKYTIAVVSDQIGPFSLRVTSSDADEDETALTSKLNELEQQVEETKAKLNALKQKKAAAQ